MTPMEIKEARLAAGLTQAALAEKLGVNSETISRWELGTAKPSDLLAYKLASWMEATQHDNQTSP